MNRLVLPALAFSALGLTAAAPVGAPVLVLPIACEVGRTCEIQSYVDRDPGTGVRDYRCGPQTYDVHSGIDFRLPDMAAQRRGVAVLAVAAGTVRNIRNDMPDQPPGKATGPQDPRACGNGAFLDHGGGWSTQYCHMALGSVTVKPGAAVVAGQALGKVGVTGNSDFPHLHLVVRHGNEVIDPFAPDMAAACGARQSPLWAPAVAAKLPYRAGAVLNAGFSELQLTRMDVETGAVRPFGPASPWMIFYVRAIGLLPGDEAELELKAPDGTRLAQVRRPPLPRARAEDFNLIGKRRPPTGWPKGVYAADYRVWRDGKVALSKRIQVTL
jgi:hypothetical protein